MQIGGWVAEYINRQIPTTPESDWKLITLVYTVVCLGVRYGLDILQSLATTRKGKSSERTRDLYVVALNVIGLFRQIFRSVFTYFSTQLILKLTKDGAGADAGLLTIIVVVALYTIADYVRIRFNPPPMDERGLTVLPR